MSARLSTIREAAEAIQVDRRTNNALSHLDYTLRDVDADDVRAYLGQDTSTVREYLDAVVDLEYEKGAMWPN